MRFALRLRAPGVKRHNAPKATKVSELYNQPPHPTRISAIGRCVCKDACVQACVRASVRACVCRITRFLTLSSPSSSRRAVAQLALDAMSRIEALHAFVASASERVGECELRLQRANIAARERELERQLEQ